MPRASGGHPFQNRGRFNPEILPLRASGIYPPRMILSLSTMWAQQERFVNDMHEFVHEARRLGYGAIR